MGGGSLLYMQEGLVTVYPTINRIIRQGFAEVVYDPERSTPP